MQEKKIIDYKSRVSYFVRNKLLKLQKCTQESTVRAQLAIMRRGIGATPGALPELWNMLFEGLPAELEGKGKEPSHSEWAIYTALTLFALHQQGKDLQKEWMHQEGVSLGHGIGQLANKDAEKEDAEEGNGGTLVRRFNILATSEDLMELSWHLRNMIQLCKRKNIALDYARLAKDLYDYQDLERMDGVRLQWGRAFYRELGTKKDEAIEPPVPNKAI